MDWTPDVPEARNGGISVQGTRFQVPSFLIGGGFSRFCFFHRRENHRHLDRRTGHVAPRTRVRVALTRPGRRGGLGSGLARVSARAGFHPGGVHAAVLVSVKETPRFSSPSQTSLWQWDSGGFPIATAPFGRHTHSRENGQGGTANVDRISGAF